MILQKKEELANRQLRLTITVERDAWEKALNDAYQEVKALYPVEGYAVGKAPREAPTILPRCVIFSTNGW